MNITASYDKESEVKETLATKNTEQVIYVSYKGGTGVDRSYNLETGVPNINPSNWEKSVNIDNSGLVEINWDKTYPIYEFISDPAKKTKIKAAVQRYIAKKSARCIGIETHLSYV